MFATIIWVCIYHIIMKANIILILTNDKIQVGNLWRVMYKLVRSFTDLAGPMRVATTVKNRLEKFKVHLPLLATLCNPGLRPRHWNSMCEAVSDLFI
jgi:hypothetical protein